MLQQGLTGVRPFSLFAPKPTFQPRRQGLACHASASKDLLNAEQRSKALELQLKRSQGRSAESAAPAATSQPDGSVLCCHEHAYSMSSSNHTCLCNMTAVVTPANVRPASVTMLSMQVIRGRFIGKKAGREGLDHPLAGAQLAHLCSVPHGVLFDFSIY